MVDSTNNYPSSSEKKITGAFENSNSVTLRLYLPQ